MMRFGDASEACQTIHKRARDRLRLQILLDPSAGLPWHIPQAQKLARQWSGACQLSEQLGEAGPVKLLRC